MLLHMRKLSENQGAFFDYRISIGTTVGLNEVGRNGVVFTIRRKRVILVVSQTIEDEQLFCGSEAGSEKGSNTPFVRNLGMGLDVCDIRRQISGTALSSLFFLAAS